MLVCLYIDSAEICFFIINMVLSLDRYSLIIEAMIIYIIDLYAILI